MLGSPTSPPVVHTFGSDTDLILDGVFRWSGDRCWPDVGLRFEPWIPFFRLKSARCTFSNMKGLSRLHWRNKLAKIGKSCPFIN